MDRHTRRLTQVLLQDRAAQCPGPTLGFHWSGLDTLGALMGGLVMPGGRGHWMADFWLLTMMKVHLSHKGQPFHIQEWGAAQGGIRGGDCDEAEPQALIAPWTSASV